MGIFTTLTFANSESAVPSWIKNNAGWWADGLITDDEFVQGIQFLIQEKIVDVSVSNTLEKKSNEVPSWIKNNAKWWAEGQIKDSDFLLGIGHLVKTGIINPKAKSEVVETEGVVESDSICKHLSGSGSNINFVIVPCRFDESDKEQISELADIIVETFESTEPYKSNLDKFSIFIINDYETTLELPKNDKYVCMQSREVKTAASACSVENMQIISLANGPAVASATRSVASVPISEEYKYTHKGYIAIHETGHSLGLDHHSCYEPAGPIVNFDWTSASHKANCGVTQISENQPCKEWQSEEYSKWVLEGDPNFGCYPICANNKNLFRPWNDEESIMCTGKGFENGFTPVERKMLYDKLLGKE